MSKTAHTIDLTAPSVTPRLEFREAWRGLNALMADKEDTSQVFRIMKALTGKSLWKQYLRFTKTETGQKVLENQIDLLDTLSDRDALAKLPAGSLGRVYLNFMIREGITAEGLVEASEDAAREFENDDFARYVFRTREMHDLWHVVTGYGRDGIGEVCVVAFSYPQTKSLGFGAIALMGLKEYTGLFPRRGLMGIVWQAYQIGRKAAWLPGADWEHLLTLPLEEVREILNISEPTKYQRIDDIIAETRPQPA